MWIALLAGTGRAFGAALVALVLSDVESGYRASFLLIWTLIFCLAHLPLGLLELPLCRRLAGAFETGRARARLFAITTLFGVLVGMTFWARAPAFACLGLLGVGASALTGALFAALLGLSPQPEPRRLRVGGWLASFALVAVLLGLCILDPNARYERRYDDAARGAQALQRATPTGVALPATLGPPSVDMALARAVADGFLGMHPDPAALRFSWEETVALVGALAYAERAEDERVYDFAERWVAAHAAELVESRALLPDACAPAIIALELLRAGRGGTPAQAVVDRVVRYVREEAPRTREGALSHAGRVAFGLVPPQAWVDSLFMHGVFFNRLATKTDDGELARWALAESRQLALAMRTHLVDPATGLFRHAYVDLGWFGGFALPVEPCFWARGNAWALYYLADYEAACRASGAPIDDGLSRLTEDLAEALVARQTDAGLWATGLSGEVQPRRNPIETGGSALMTAGLARARNGSSASPSRYAEAVDRARGGLRTRLRLHGSLAFVLGTSVGTHPGFRHYYRSIPLREHVGHGIGGMLLALVGG
ncbi:MAG: glycoside hydrolase family 88 protein [Planctomycetota bacterium]|jgi:rhamnogalacturonyl hydrolase YesR